MGTLIYKLLMWLGWQGLKAIHVLLKSEKVEYKVVRPTLDAVL